MLPCGASGGRTEAASSLLENFIKMRRCPELLFIRDAIISSQVFLV